MTEAFTKEAESLADIPKPSAPDINDLPPNYFDISRVPDGGILYYNQMPPITDTSAATIKRETEGVLSLDQLIDRNPDELWLYFMTYLRERPILDMSVHGYHKEHYVTYQTVRSANGHSHTQPVHQTRTVTDFQFTFDLSSYISQQWWRVAVIPSKASIRSGQTVNFRSAIEQYTMSDKRIKEIICRKQLVGWNFIDLINKVRTLIYSTGYGGYIDVKFIVKNNRIISRSSSNLSRFSNSLLVRVLCILTCLWIIFGPIYLCLRSAGSVEDKIVADYTMLMSGDDFIRCNAAMITNAAMTRSHQRYIAYFS